MKILLLLLLVIALNADVCTDAINIYKNTKAVATKNNKLTKRQCRVVTKSMISMFLHCDYDNKEKVKIAKKVFIMQSQCGI